MNHLVWRDYFRSFRWRNIKATLGKTSGLWINSIWPCFYAVTVLPLNLLGYEGSEYGRYLIGLIPFILTYFSEWMAGLSLPKIMFMCPMTASERKEYLEKMLRMKVIVPNVFMIVAMLGALLFNATEPVFAIPLMLQNIMTAAGIVFLHADNIIIDRSTGSGYCVAQWIISMVVEFMLLHNYAVGRHTIEYFPAIWAGISVSVQLPLLYGMYRYKNRIFDLVLNVEKDF